MLTFLKVLKRFDQRINDFEILRGHLMTFEVILHLIQNLGLYIVGIHRIFFIKI